MGYRIKRVDHNDIDIVDELLDLQKLCFGNTAPIVDPEKEGEWWICYAPDGSTAGFCSVKQSSVWKSWGFLSRAGVLPAHQGRGLHRRLITVRERYAKKVGWHGLFTYTVNNPQSANNLIKAGYRIYEPKKPWAWGCPTAIYFKKGIK